MKTILIVFLISIQTISQTLNLNSLPTDYQRTAPVPQLIQAKMDSFVISRTGSVIFREYFVFDSSISGFHPANPSYQQTGVAEGSLYIGYDRFSICYQFRFPKKPWRKINFSWFVDTLGVLLTSPYGIPDCTDSLQCIFSVDSLEAIKIARSNGIEPGGDSITAELTAGFPYFDKGKIVWDVMSVTRNVGFRKEDHYFVDINTGKIVNKWSSSH